MAFFLFTSGVLTANTWLPRIQNVMGYSINFWTRFLVTLLLYSFVFVVEAFAVRRVLLAASPDGFSSKGSIHKAQLQGFRKLCVGAAIIGLLYGLIATPLNFRRAHFGLSGKGLAGTSMTSITWGPDSGSVAAGLETG